MNDTGLSNTIIGTSTGNDLVSGDYNTIIGANVSGLNSTDSSQVIISEGQGNIRFWAKSNGSTAVGTGTLTSPTTGAALEVQGTLGGLRHPRLTTTERTALANLAGNVVYDTTLFSLYVNDGATWSAVGGGGGSSPIIASARMSTGFIPIGLVGADVIFDTEDIDTNAAFNTTTGIFTAPTTGNYLISSQVTLDTVLLSGGDSLQMSILRNGTSVAKDTLLINNGAIESSSSLSQSRIISLTAGQTIGVSVSKSSGTVNIVANGGFETYISITSL